MKEGGGEFIGVLVILAVGVGIIWFIINQEKQAQALAATQQLLPPGTTTAQQLAAQPTAEKLAFNSIPGGALADYATAAAASYELNHAVVASAGGRGPGTPGNVSVGLATPMGTHTDTAGNTVTSNVPGQLVSLQISNKPIYAVSGGAELSVLATGGLSLFSSTNRDKVESDLKFWDW
jgi:hypothetical protein